VGNESHNNTSGDRGLGTIKKRMDKYIPKILGDTRIQELQKITLLGTSHILRKALSIK